MSTQNPKVVHCKRAVPNSFVYVGRPTKWGNKFTHKSNTAAEFIVSSREAAVEAFEKWIMSDEQENLRTAVRTELKGKDLGCWCAPLACHAEVLLRIANEF